MCGVLGVKFKNNTSYQFISKVLDALTIRGTHAFGIAYELGNSITTVKTLDLDTLKSNIKQLCQKGISFIYHNRYSTSGNFKDSNNNLPAGNEETGYLSFNGVLEQSSPRFWKEKYGVDCQTQNDGEILLKLLQKGQDLIDILNMNQHWSIAGVFLKNEQIFGFRNNKRPLYHYQDQNLSMYISTVDPIARIDIGLIRNLKVVPTMELVCLN